MVTYTSRNTAKQDPIVAWQEHNQALKDLNVERAKLRERLRAITLEVKARRAAMVRLNAAVLPGEEDYEYSP